MQNNAYTPAARKKIDQLQTKLESLKKQQRTIEQQIEETAAGQSPIKPGDHIEWDTGKRTLHGTVISVQPTYNGYEYRCHTTNKQGKEIGYATVHTTKNPTLIPKHTKRRQEIS